MGERQVTSRGPVEPTVERAQGCVLKHLLSQICLVQDLGGNSHVIRFLRLMGDKSGKEGQCPASSLVLCVRGSWLCLFWGLRLSSLAVPCQVLLVWVKQGVA